VDDGIENDITKLCCDTIPSLRKAIIDRITFETDDHCAAFETEIKAAESEFVDGLGSQGVRRDQEAF
jgi:hypothetical protein